MSPKWQASPLLSSLLLLPPWMFLARATAAPILSPLLPYLGCFLLLVSLLTLIVTHAVATLDVSCSCHRCLPIAAIAVATWDVSSLLVVLPPSSCHHGLYHLGVFLLLPLGLLLLLVPMLTLILRTNIAIATLDCSCCSWSCLPHLVTMAATTLEFSC